MLIDSHCHLDFPDFTGELDAVVGRARAADIAPMVTISTRVARHAELLAIAERFPDVYCSVGTHPHHADEELDITADDLLSRAQHSKVVAIGEAGLDYHYERSPRAAQERGFRTHIKAACRWSFTRARPTPTPPGFSRRKPGRAPSPLCFIVSPGARSLPGEPSR